MTKNELERTVKEIKNKVKAYNAKYDKFRKLTFKGLMDMYGISKTCMYYHMSGNVGLMRKTTEGKIKSVLNSSLSVIHKKRFG